MNNNILIENYDLLISNILDTLNDYGSNGMSYDIENKIVNFYTKEYKSIYLYLREFINEKNINDIFNYTDLNKNLLKLRSNAIKSYLTGFEKCGYLQKINKQPLSYKIKNKIVGNVLASDILDKKVQLLL